MAVWRELTAALGGGAASTRAGPAGLHATRSATLQAGKEPLGRVGEVARTCSQRFGVAERVAILESNLDQFLAREPKPTQWKPTSRQPSSDLDLAFVLDRVDPRREARQGDPPGRRELLVDLDLFDVYRGDRSRRHPVARLPAAAPGRRSQPHRADVADVRRGVEAAATKLGAELRS